MSDPLFDTLSATRTPDGRIAIHGHRDGGDQAAVAELDDDTARWLATTLTALLERSQLAVAT